MKPEIKLMALSNVYIRMMNFVNKGDSELGHLHTFDHATMVSSGSVLYEVLDSYDGNVLHSKQFTAPNMIFVHKDKYHRITSLEDNTVCSCIHAIRTVDEELVSPEFLIEPIIANSFNGTINDLVKEKYDKDLLNFAIPRNE
jgi:hypothetical protein